MRKLVFAVILNITISTSVFAYSGGTGEPNSPYQIANKVDLLALAANTADYGKCFILTSDVNMQGQVFTTAIIAPDTIASNYNFDGPPFTGIFDGNRHKIINFTINGGNTNKFLGLFGKIDTGGSVNNLGLENFSVSGYFFIGGLVGINTYGNISNCYSNGQTNGSSSSQYVGGLAGENGGTINNCLATGAVTGSSYVGGLVGVNDRSINNCYSTAQVNGNGAVGGLVGYNDSSVINCYSIGYVNGNNGFGGLIGSIGCCFDRVVSTSFWDIQTSGQSDSSGGRGLTTSQMKTLAIFRDAGWGTGDWVMADGIDYPRLSWEVTAYPVIPPAEPVPLPGSGTEENPYQISTPDDFALLSWYPSILDKHIILMNDINVAGESLYQIGDCCTPFTGVFDGNSHIIKNACLNLPSTNYVGIFGYLGSGSQVKNVGVEDVNITGQYMVGGFIGYGYNNSNVTNCYSAGSVYGTGGYPGGFVGGLIGGNDGNIINCNSNVSLRSDGYGAGGLVGINDHYGNITDCFATGSVKGEGDIGGLAGSNYGNIRNCNSVSSILLDGDGYYIGGLLGQNRGNVINCFATGCIKGREYIGGLVGYNRNGFISSCYSTGDVTGTLHYCGGLVGYNENGNVNNCYANGSISSGHDSVGGLVGSNNKGKIIQCYSTGKPSGRYDVGGLCGDKTSGGNYADIGNFWDTQTSLKSTSAMGSGKTTSEMKSQNTFTSAGWDFSYTDGNSAVWFMPPNDYPILSWQISPADIYTDGRNNFKDFAILAEYWLRDDCAIYNYFCDFADLDFSGDVGIDDIIILANSWLTTGIY